VAVDVRVGIHFVGKAGVVARLAPRLTIIASYVADALTPLPFTPSISGSLAWPPIPPLVVAFWEVTAPQPFLLFLASVFPPATGGKAAMVAASTNTATTDTTTLMRLEGYTSY